MERLARMVVFGLLVIAVAIPSLGRVWHQPASAGSVEMRSRLPSSGGWSVDDLTVRVGEPLELRLTSDDVVHGFAVGRHDAPAIVVEPGKWVTTMLRFDEPGTYTFYCTRWCGEDHWRMRGTIEVTGDGPAAGTISPPRYVRLGIDPDAPQPAPVVPEERPAAVRGRVWAERLPAYVSEDDTYWGNSPSDLWLWLREEPALADLSDRDLWDAVAWVWASHVDPVALAAGERIYRQEAAAAHGETGAGDGVMVEGLPPYDYDIMSAGHGAIKPPDFTDPHHTFGASPARLEGKMLRGGMGTGMPSYGELYTPEEIEGMVAFVYTFVMDLDLPR